MDIMKVTLESQKGLKTNLKVFVDKKTIDEKIEIRLLELSKTVNIKGFRPGKVPTNVLKYRTSATMLFLLKKYPNKLMLALSLTWELNSKVVQKIN